MVTDNLVVLGLVTMNLLLLSGLAFTLVRLNNRLKLLTKNVYFQIRKTRESEIQVKKQLSLHSDNVLEEVVQLSVLAGRLENVAVSLKNSVKVQSATTSTSSAQVSRIKQAVQKRGLDHKANVQMKDVPNKALRKASSTSLGSKKSILPERGIDDIDEVKENNQIEDVKIKKLSSILGGQYMRKVRLENNQPDKVRINER